MANDPEYAEMIVEQEDPDAKWSPRLSQWDLNVTLLSQILSAIGGVQNAVIASVGGKPTPFKPFPQPETEIDKARKNLEKRAASAILEMAGFNPSDFL